MLLIIIVGGMFFNLAKNHGKNKWLFGILGAVSYLGGTFIAGLALGFLIGYGIIDELGKTQIYAVSIPTGIISAIITYRILVTQWKKKSNADSEFLDAEIIDEL